jgi:hypothetical protein
VIFEQNHDTEPHCHDRTQPVSLKFEQSFLPDGSRRARLRVEIPGSGPRWLTADDRRQ